MRQIERANRVLSCKYFVLADCLLRIMTICQSCHEREAVNHTMTVIDGVAHKTDLCAECFERLAPQDFRELNATCCFFCGDEFNVGGTDPIGQALGIHRLRFFCFRCSRLYFLAASRVLRTIPKDLPKKEQREALLATLDDEVERRVTERMKLPA
jgi:hypothetical protein